MKKLLISALAVGMLTACSQDETVEMQAPNAIAFASAYVNNATRAADPSYNNENNLLTSFDVWGYVGNSTGTVFDDVTVTKSGSEWKYDVLQYWVPGNTYHFYALAAANSKNVAMDINDPYNNGLGDITFTNVDGTEDILYAAAQETTPSTIAVKPEKVLFTFDHLLSKVKFSFTNGFTTEYSDIVVTNIKMVAPKAGTVNLNEQTETTVYAWKNHEGTTTLNFGSMSNGDRIGEGDNGESDNERLTIPAAGTQEYIVTFDVKLYQDEVVVLSKSKQVTITGCELQAGYAYNFIATLDPTNIGDNPLFPIEFEAEVEEWEEGDLFDGGVIDTESLSAIENTTVAADEVLTLEESKIVEASLSVAGTLDGAGNMLLAAETPGNNGMVKPTGTATVKNVTIDGENRAWNDNGTMRGLRAIYITTGGTYTLDNVTTEDVTYSINVNTTADVTLNVSNSLLEGWASWGTSTTATFNNVDFTTNPDAVSLIRPQGTATFTNCTFDADFKFSLDLLAETLTFKNCTWNGAALTAETIKSMITTAYYEAGLDASANLDKVVFE